MESKTGKIECRICGEAAHFMELHLVKAHDMTVEVYKGAYSDAPVVSELAKAHLASLEARSRNDLVDVDIYKTFGVRVSDKVTTVKAFKHPHETTPAIDPDYVRELKKEYTGLWFKRFIQGLWVLAEGSVYDMWLEDVMATDATRIAEAFKESFSRYFVAVDYGTNNPCTFGLFRHSGKLPVYLEREYYYDSQKAGKQKTDGEYADDFIKFVGDIKPHHVYVDPSAASFIAELRKRGFNVVGANNDVVAGIRFVGNLLSKHLLYVSKECRETIKEFASYVWDEKAQKKGEDKPVKLHDHCFVGETKISTLGGVKDIKDVEVGEYVLTSGGFRRVLDSRCTWVKPVFEFDIDGHLITSTEGHNLITTSGKKQIKDIVPGDTLFHKEDKPCLRTLLNTTVERLRWIRGDITGISEATERALTTFIERYGKIRSGLSQKDMRSIIRTTTRIIILLKILTALEAQSTEVSIPESTIEKTKKRLESTLRRLGHWQPNGTGAKRGGAGIGKMLERPGKAEKIEGLFANTAGRLLKQTLRTAMSDFAQTDARALIEEQVVQIVRSELAFIAGKYSRRTNTIKPFVVQDHVRRNPVGKRRVYNLTVDGVHEYVANGILVANCMDMLRYGVFTHFFSEYPKILMGFNYK